MLLVLAVSAVWPGTSAAQQLRPELEENALKLFPEETAFLAAHPNPRIGFMIDAPPVIFRGEDGRMQGMVADYMALVTQRIGLKPRQIIASSFKSLLELAKAREVDLVSVVANSPERSRELLISRPYLLLPIVVVTRSDFPFIAGLNDLRGRSVAVGQGHLAHLRLAKDYPGLELLPVTGSMAGLRAVANGQVDAYVAPQASVEFVSRQAGFTTLKVAAITQYNYQLSIGVRKDWPEMLDLVNRALDTISQAERREIYDYWSVMRSRDWVDRSHSWRIAFYVGGGAVFVLAVFLFWNRRLAREVRMRQLAEDRLREAMVTNREIIESTDVIIVGLDSEGRVQLFNAAGERITGYTRDELAGKDWFDVVVPRERFPYVREEFARLMAAGEGVQDTFQNPILTRSGELRHILWRNSAIAARGTNLAMVSFGTDVTNRVRAEEELRLTQFAMDNAAVAIFRLKPDGSIDYANIAAMEMFGYSRAEMSGLRVLDLDADLDQDAWPELLATIKAQGKVVMERTGLTRKSGLLPIEVTAYRLSFKGNEMVIAFVQDIAERKRLEALRDDVERMIRHDLKSPALATQTLFKLLRNAENLTDSQRGLVDSVGQAGDRMVRLINLSHALYKMEEGSYLPTLQRVDLLRVLDTVGEELGPLLRAKNVSLSMTLSGKPVGPNNVFSVPCEEILGYALLSNLVRNAVEASPERETVNVDLHTGDRHRIVVSNKGAVPAAIRSRFFDKYVTHGKKRGTGLGTYTARLVTTTLGGDIRLDVPDSTTTRITVLLPKK